MSNRFSRKLKPLFAPQSRPPFRILLDESVTPYLRDVIPASFAQVITTRPIGLEGKPDKELWDWAVAHRCDAIITHDWSMKHKEGLTPIAIDAARHAIESGGGPAERNRLPLIIHLGAEGRQIESMREIMEKFGEKLAGHIRNIRKATISYIHVSHAGIKPGRSYAEIAAEDAEKNLRYQPRIEQREKKWKEKIISRRGGELDRTKTAALEEQIHAAALACAPPAI